jgi:hypothetical protein
MDKKRQPFKIICTKDYEFEGTIMKIGNIGYNSAYQPIPDNWERYSPKEKTGKKCIYCENKTSGENISYCDKCLSQEDS